MGTDPIKLLALVLLAQNLQAVLRVTQNYTNGAVGARESSQLGGRLRAHLWVIWVAHDAAEEALSLAPASLAEPGASPLCLYTHILPPQLRVLWRPSPGLPIRPDSGRSKPPGSGKKRVAAGAPASVRTQDNEPGPQAKGAATFPVSEGVSPEHQNTSRCLSLKTSTSGWGARSEVHG